MGQKKLIFATLSLISSIHTHLYMHHCVHSLKNTKIRILSLYNRLIQDDNLTEFLPIQMMRINEQADE